MPADAAGLRIPQKQILEQRKSNKLDETNQSGVDLDQPFP
jgi:hypothetical protein